MPNATISTLIDPLRSEASAEVALLLTKAADHNIPVLIYGETGAGKDVWASFLHERKGRGRLINLHCADIPDTLLESQWFGYVKGAFTGATRDHAGLWLQAQGGTLLLNRIDLLKPDMQSKLLRVIERKRFFPLGSAEEKEFETDLVFSAGDEIHRLVETGVFRSDLFYRISAFSVRIPPLRERVEDILPLLHFFAERNEIPVQIGRSTEKALCAHSWPGNIRELENLVQRCAIGDRSVRDETVMALIEARTGFSVPHFQEMSLHDFERQYINTLLNRYQNKAQVARILGITRKTLYNKLKSNG